jgi:hypothetical protein
MKWIYVPFGDARQDEKPPSNLVTKFPVSLKRITIPVFLK